MEEDEEQEDEHPNVSLDDIDSEGKVGETSRQSSKPSPFIKKLKKKFSQKHGTIYIIEYHEDHQCIFCNSTLLCGHICGSSQ
jgi:hypothetical protein